VRRPKRLSHDARLLPRHVGRVRRAARGAL
jgi:hypothetical protein